MVDKDPRAVGRIGIRPLQASQVVEPLNRMAFDGLPDDRSGDRLARQTRYRIGDPLGTNRLCSERVLNPLSQTTAA